MPTLSIDPRNTQVDSDAENIALLYQATEFPEGQTVVPAFSLVIGFDGTEVDLDEAAIAASLPAGASLVTTPPPQIEDTDNTDGNDDTNQLLILSIQNLPVAEEQQTLLTVPITTSIDLDEAPVTFDVGTELSGVDVEAIPTVTITEDGDGDGDGDGDDDDGEAPVFEDDSPEFSLDENTEGGTVVGTVTATDPNGDDIIYDISAGNDDIDGDVVEPFVIDPDTGEISVNDSEDIDFEAFEEDAVFELTTTATDPDGNSDTATVTVEITDVAALTPSEDNDGVLSLTDLDNNLLFAPVATEVDTVNEVGFFLVDENGDIVVDEEGDDAEAETLSPGDDGYLDAALEDARAIFSVLADPPPNFDTSAVERIVERTTGENLGFFVVNNGTVADVLASNSDEREGLDITLSTDPDSEIEISEAEDDGGFDISFGEGLTVNAQATSDAPPPGTDIQNQVLPEFLDLRDFDEDTVNLSVRLTREADFDNVVGLYEVANASGAVIDPVTGDTINPTATNYIDVVLDNFATQVGSVADEDTATFDFELDGGSLYAPFILVQSNESEGFDDIYTPFLGANSDGVDHIRLLGDNVFGFEDLPGGGDLDYNDVVAEVTFA